VNTADRLSESAPACLSREFPGNPDLALLAALVPQRYPHLLESVAHGPPQARFDILFAFPGSTLQLNGNGTLLADRTPVQDDFLSLLDRSWRASRISDQEDLPFPFHGGWFLYLGYELAGILEPSLGTIPRDPDWPMAFAQRIPAAIVRDHATGKTMLLCEPGHEALLDQMELDLHHSIATSIDTILPDVLSMHEEDPAIHRHRIERALEYIRSGDTYQANLSRFWEIHLAERSAAPALYMKLRKTNPAPFSGLSTLGMGQSVISSSPERLVSVRHGSIHTRPIAGTHPRATEAIQDIQRRASLKTHPKERAEHVMLVDLERNDLGRICRSGSVQVDELLVVESYQHVHHLVSNVSGVLRPGILPGDIIRAVFPGGTITGCPKLRTMQIIAELEQSPRRAYTGSMGYLNRDGSLDLNILIRTMTLDDRKVLIRAGGGIVADSLPDREIEETRAKARGLLSVFSPAEQPC